MNVLARVRKTCLALPEATEKAAWGAPTFRVKGKLFAMFTVDHHGDGRVALWLKAASGAQEMLVEANPEVFFRPPYVGPSGWVGVRLDRDLGWGVVEGLVREAWLEAAPKRVRQAFLDAEGEAKARKAGGARRGGKAPASRGRPASSAG